MSHYLQHRFQGHSVSLSLDQVYLVQRKTDTVSLKHVYYGAQYEYNVKLQNTEESYDNSYKSLVSAGPLCILSVLLHAYILYISYVAIIILLISAREENRNSPGRLRKIRLMQNTTAESFIFEPCGLSRLLRHRYADAA